MAQYTTKLLSPSNYKLASPGKFRVVRWIVSEPYQLGDEQDTIEGARKIAEETTETQHQAINTNIYDDRGQEMFKR